MHYNRPFSLKRTELVILPWNHNICGTKPNPKDNYNVYIEIQAGCIYKTRRVNVFRGCKSIWNNWNPIFKSFSCIDNSVNKYIGILVEFLFPIGLPKEPVPPFLYCLDVKQNHINAREGLYCSGGSHVLKCTRDISQWLLVNAAYAGF